MAHFHAPSRASSIANLLQGVRSTAAALLLLLCLGVLMAVALLPLTSGQQWIFGGCLVGVALWADAASRAYLTTLMMVSLSCFATLRYGIWRYHTLFTFFRYPSLQRLPLDVFFMSVLALAELYTILVLYLGYFQTVFPLPRKPVELPTDVAEWPHVDVLIPTYNEPLELVRYTVLAAMNMDWPVEKMHIFLLDDGRRAEFRGFAEKAGIAYVTRSDNEGAKAGNINHALRNTHAPFVAIFDCDHVPVRSFLQVTMGWFFRDPRAALVQTPHHFYSPDPFERNLKQFRAVPNEGQLFYGIVQVCNDFWNASFFCGSCAVIRRQALNEVGGVATETVTEDAHTSLRMQMAGWNTAYLNTPQAAGLATESLSGHIKQRIRWARGMVQILRRENPLMALELSWPQRVCYFNAMMHFLYALPRLIFLTVPLVYLLFGYKVIPGSWDIILAFALPHIFLAQIASSRIQGEHRHSFWNEIYETVLAPYILLPTLLALVHPKIGKFDVTGKGGVVEESYFDMRIAQPFFALLFFCLLGLCMVPVRLLYLDPLHPGTVLINGLWDMLSIVIIGVAIGVSYESQQRRESVRVAMRTVARIVLPDGTSLEGRTVDLSAGGSAIHLDEPFPPSQGAEVQVVLPRPSTGSVSLPARVVGGGGRVVRVRFEQLSIAQERKLVGVLFSRANAWTNWGDNTTHDSLGRSFALIVKLSLRGLRQAVHSLVAAYRTWATDRTAATAVSSTAGSTTAVLMTILLGAMSAGVAVPRLDAQAGQPEHRQPTLVADSAGGRLAPPAPPAPATENAPADAFHLSYSLAELGSQGPVLLRGVSSERTLAFVLPQTKVARQSSLRVRYFASPALIPALSHINVLLNGTIFASLPVAVQRTKTTASLATPGAAAVLDQPDGQTMEQTVTLPADLLVHRNTLTFQLIGHYTVTECEDPANTAIWAQIDPETTLDVAGSRLAMANDLDLLPLPFFDRNAGSRLKVAIVFLAQPTEKELEAAGVVASWLGIMADYRGMELPVSIGRVPPGNAIVFGTPTEGLADTPVSAIAPPTAETPASTEGLANATASAQSVPTLAQFGLGGVGSATVAMRTNPADPFGKLLIVAGKDGEQLVEAARALATNPGALAGDTARVSMHMPAPRLADDAPRWLDTSYPARVGQMQVKALESDGSVPVDTYLRTAPDLYYGLRRNLRLHLYYRYNPVPLAPRAHLSVSINQGYAASIPLPGGERVSHEGNVVLGVPAEDMAPSANTLNMNFFLPIAKSGPCQDGTVSRPRAAILPDSYLDVDGVPHWAALPNLQLFSNAGFPFTRFADLAQTTVVMPQHSSPAEIELLLTLLAHMGAQTGYPALRLTVGNAQDMGVAADRDYLVLGTQQDQSAFASLGDRLPVVLAAQGVQVRHSSAIFAPVQHFWWRIQGRPVPEGGHLGITGELPDALLEAVESPYRPGRSVVLVMVRSDAQVAPFLAAFADAVDGSAIAQSVSVLHGASFHSYRLGDSLYHVGKLPLWDLLSVYLAAFPYLGVLFLLLVCLLLASIAQRWLRQRAVRRLRQRAGRGADGKPDAETHG
ncbi:MAG: UDP-forming cellulose synthase catalytic subunit [Acidobacteriaceae bacterium]